MRNKLLILFAVLSFILLSCESKDKWINQHDSKADAGDTAKICKQAEVECGKKWINYNGVDLEIDCGECSDGYECRFNTCWDINECENPDLNDCPEHSTCANEEGTYSCICDDNYTWIDSECVEKPQEEPNTDDSGDSTPADNDTSDSTDDSDSAPDNADSTPDEEPDTADSIDDSGDSEPDDSDSKDDGDTSAPDEDTDTVTVDPCVPNPCTDVPYSTGNCAVEGNGYTCECRTHYSWTGSVCKADKQVVDCIGKPENSSWNSATSITQTWDGNDWYPPATGTYNENPSNEECRYVCNVAYNWNGLLCFRELTPGSLTLGNICTGQDKCYNNRENETITCPSSSNDDFYGQDAYYANLDKCTPQSFTVSSNVVVDNNTGLVWEKSPSSNTYTWANRNTHCSELNSSNYGGKNNWRVPNPLELLTIVDSSRLKPATNSNFTEMPTSSLDASNLLWTNNEYKNDTSKAYYFTLYYGAYVYREKNSTYKVLCVSGDELTAATSNDFVTSSDGKIVTDNKTGLIWQKEYATDKTWQQALKYCEDSTYAGYSDWRLPNRNELASLINYEKLSGSPYSYFPDMPSFQFWSSSSYEALRNDAWVVYFNYGYVVGISKSYTSYISYVRCVR